MTSKIFKNNQIFEIMNSMAITLKEILKALEIPLEKFRNLKKIYIMTPMRSFFHFMMLIYIIHQDHQWICKTHQKEQVPKEKRYLHRTQLNLPEPDFQMPDIPIENFSTLFGNTLEDAKKYLFRFNNTCYVLNLIEENVKS
jgi:hypothetical protein